MNFGASFKAIMQLGRKQRGKLIAATVCAVLADILALVPFACVYFLLNEIYKGTLVAGTVWWLAGLSLGAIVLSLLAVGGNEAFAHLGAYQTLYDIRLNLARKLGRIRLGYFTQRNSGDLKKVMQEDVEGIELFLAHAIPSIATALFLPITTFVFLLIVDWRMALAVFASLPVSVLIFMLLMLKRARPMMEPYQKATLEVNSSVIQYVQGMPVIKAFNQTAHSFEQVSGSISRLAETASEWGKRVGLGYAAFYTSLTATAIFILPVGLWLITAGSLTPPTLVLALLLGLGFNAPLLNLFYAFGEFWYSLGGVDRVLAVMNEPELSEPAKRKVPQGFDIEFKDVSFSYNQTPILKKVSFKVPQGTITALVGPSGAGKTTAARLVPRFWDVDEGEVLVGGVNVKDITTTELMTRVAFVFQDVYLFNATILENIRLGRPQASEAEVIEVAKAARCHDFIMALPKGYHTPVGEGGATLSGGEKQRISIARALLKAAPIIVLDEATAFADPENESLIQEAIGELIVGKTLIVIAHRLSTIVEADQILVLNEGEIVERGKHAELLSQQGLYSRMWQAHQAAQEWEFGNQALERL
jgi:ATP-binding cassette subfamily B protein